MIPTIRCVMPTHPQPGLDCDPAITRDGRGNAHRCLGCTATFTPGRITEGDVLRLDRPDWSRVARRRSRGQAR